MQLAEQPVAGYDGHVAGYAATEPAEEGTKVESDSAAAERYAEYLDAKGARAREEVGSPEPIYEFSTVFPGFAAELTGEQAEQLSQQPGITAVTKDILLQPDSAAIGGSPAGGGAAKAVLRTSKALGLEARGGLWDVLGGSKRAGAGVVIGLIDTGIWPESESFDPMSARTWMRGQPYGWKGSCVAGEDDSFPVSRCSDKIVGAKYFVDGFGRVNVGEDYLSPRDGDGHGSNTASIAAGNFGPDAVMPDGNDLGVVSGIAPGAHIAAYKACWNGRTGAAATDGCSAIDTVAAIEAAVADGVDVLNYSLGATAEATYFGANEIALMYAAQAGVFVTTSAGNNGPGLSTLDHPSPWLTTTAAATYTVNESTVAFGDGTSYIGASTTLGLPAAPLVESVASKSATATDEDARLCKPGSLDPAEVTGAIVLCDRGDNPRTEKSSVVQQAGGVGMVLVNTSNAGTNGDYHFVPTVHIEFEDQAKYDAIHAYARSAGATAAILAGEHDGSTTVTPRIIEFSSRGPSKQGSGDILKPDIAAPGVDVLAASAPAANSGRDYDYLSGTSQASPHVAGLAALLLELHPRWTPMMVKSAIMTSATDTTGGTTSPFDQGAGYLNPNRAASPGLVYNSGADDWWAFLRGQNCTFGCPVGPSLAASDLNQASIAVGALAGSRSITRSVRGVGLIPEIYKATVSGIPGFTATVSPSTIVVRPGKTVTFTVTFNRTDAPLNTFATGSLTWKGLLHTARSPIAVRAVAYTAPTAISAPASVDGSVNLAVTPGAPQLPITAVLRGLVGATPVAGEVAVPPVGGATRVAYSLRAPGVSTDRYTFRFQTQGKAGDDIDVNCGTAVGSSTGPTADETLTVRGVPGNYAFTCTVIGYAAADGRAKAPFTASWWFVNQNTESANATLPATTVAGRQGVPVPLPVTWTGLDPAQRYLGYADLTASGVTSRTYITIG